MMNVVRVDSTPELEEEAEKNKKWFSDIAIDLSVVNGPNDSIDIRITSKKDANGIGMLIENAAQKFNACNRWHSLVRDDDLYFMLI